MTDLAYEPVHIWHDGQLQPLGEAKDIEAIDINEPGFLSTPKEKWTFSCSIDGATKGLEELASMMSGTARRAIDAAVAVMEQLAALSRRDGTPNRIVKTMIADHTGKSFRSARKAVAYWERIKKRELKGEGNILEEKRWPTTHPRERHHQRARTSCAASRSSGTASCISTDVRIGTDAGSTTSSIRRRLSRRGKTSASAGITGSLP